ncbi:MAG: hypothetical protein WCH83_00250 [Alphaproteobacteria bacterium]|jgi:hypothetical protein
MITWLSTARLALTLIGTPGIVVLAAVGFLAATSLGLQATSALHAAFRSAPKAEVTVMLDVVRSEIALRGRR